MNGKLSPFQMIIFGVLVFIIIVAVLIFALQRQEAAQKSAPITMWGTLSSSEFENIQREINASNLASVNVTYTEKDPETFEAEFVEALASGVGPDAVLMSMDLLLKHQNKFLELDYQLYPAQDYKNTFIEASEKLLTQNGILGFPFSVDPLVLYWNRTILNSNGISLPPDSWEDFVEVTPTLVRRDDNFNINRAAVALGEFRNINHAKEIFISLMMQSGNDVVVRTLNSDGDEVYETIFADRLGFSLSPANATLNFYTQFSNPANNLYTWNRSLPTDQEMFISNDLAFYIGYASEVDSIRRQNPNLNFGVAMLPQRDPEDKSVYADLQFLAIVRNSNNQNNAVTNIYNFISPIGIKTISNQLSLPPVRRDLLAETPADDVFQTFNDSALASKAFFDPDEKQTQNIFLEMVESFISGRVDLSASVLNADRKIDNLID